MTQILAFRKRLAAVLLVSLLVLAEGVPASDDSDPEALALLHKSEALMRGQGTEGRYLVHIVRPDWQRTLLLRSIDDVRNDRYRLEMLKPRKVKGTVFLKKEGKLTLYLPKLWREIAISPAMMHDPWMGSDFNNQDLGTLHRLKYQPCLSMAPSSALRQGLHTTSMRPLARLEYEALSGAILVL